MIIGFLLALLVGGGFYYYRYIKDHPGSAKVGMEKVEEGWTKVKSGGDVMLQKAKPMVEDLEQPYEVDSPIVRNTGIELKEK